MVDQCFLAAITNISPCRPVSHCRSDVFASRRVLTLSVHTDLIIIRTVFAGFATAAALAAATATFTVIGACGSANPASGRTGSVIRPSGRAGGIHISARSDFFAFFRTGGFLRRIVFLYRRLAGVIRSLNQIVDIPSRRAVVAATLRIVGADAFFAAVLCARTIVIELASAQSLALSVVIVAAAAVLATVIVIANLSSSAGQVDALPVRTGLAGTAIVIIGASAFLSSGRYAGVASAVGTGNAGVRLLLVFVASRISQFFTRFQCAGVAHTVGSHHTRFRRVFVVRATRRIAVIRTHRTSVVLRGHGAAIQFFALVVRTFLAARAGIVVAAIDAFPVFGTVAVTFRTTGLRASAAIRIFGREHRTRQTFSVFQIVSPLTFRRNDTGFRIIIFAIRASCRAGIAFMVLSVETFFAR